MSGGGLSNGRDMFIRVIKQRPNGREGGNSYFVIEGVLLP